MEKEDIIKHLKDNGLYIVKKSDFESLISLAGKAYDYIFICIGVNTMKKV